MLELIRLLEQIKVPDSNGSSRSKTRDFEKGVGSELPSRVASHESSIIFPGDQIRILEMTSLPGSHSGLFQPPSHSPFPSPFLPLVHTVFLGMESQLLLIFENTKSIQATKWNDSSIPPL